MSDHFKKLLEETDTIKKLDASLSDWREELCEGEEHPYVEVMPTEGAGKPKKLVKKEDKPEEKKEKEEVKESIKDDPEHRANFKAAADNVAKGMEERRKKLQLKKEVKFKRDK